ncbi:unnamed protein product [Auanema sp. JU1783]|nr:unnamed protein product [Auanema sp. JU1783]
MVQQQTRQSPIDITGDYAVHDPDFCAKDKINVTYVPGDCIEVVATEGRGFTVNVKDGCKTTLAANHLPGNYELVQFHAHWAECGERGSEHLVKGKAYSGEVHFVFRNTKYPSFCESLDKEDGLAVLGVFLQEGKHSENYQPLMEAIKKSSESSEPTKLPASLDIQNLLPNSDDREFITYPGSLTTPPFSECVIWTVLLQPVEVSKQQLDVLRSITPANHRGCQSICDRIIRCSVNF